MKANKGKLDPSAVKRIVDEELAPPKAERARSSPRRSRGRRDARRAGNPPARPPAGPPDRAGCRSRRGPRSPAPARACDRSELSPDCAGQRERGLLARAGVGHAAWSGSPRRVPARRARGGRRPRAPAPPRRAPSSDRPGTGGRARAFFRTRLAAVTSASAAASAARPRPAARARGPAARHPLRSRPPGRPRRQRPTARGGRGQRGGRLVQHQRRPAKGSPATPPDRGARSRRLLASRDADAAKSVAGLPPLTARRGDARRARRRTSHAAGFLLTAARVRDGASVRPRPAIRFDEPVLDGPPDQRQLDGGLGSRRRQPGGLRSR